MYTQLNIRVSEALKRRLKIAAADSGIPMERVAAEAIAAHVSKLEKSLKLQPQDEVAA